MKIIPAIDLYEGRCVRLSQGKFDAMTQYSDQPLTVAQSFAQSGCQWLHLVDLCGAKDPQQRQLKLIEQIVSQCQLQVQVGGGIRTQTEIDDLFAHGATRIVLGTTAITQTENVKQWLLHYGPERIVVALDVNIQDDGIPYVASHGWQQMHSHSLFSVIDQYPLLQHLLCTDIKRDGELCGPNFSLYEQILAHYPKLALQASGGISHLQHIQKLKQIGVAGSVLGRALYENQLSLSEVMTVC